MGGIFSIFFSYNIQHCFICRPSDSTVPTDAGIEPRTVATIVHWQSDALTTKLDLIRSHAHKLVIFLLLYFFKCTKQTLKLLYKDNWRWTVHFAYYEEVCRLPVGNKKKTTSTSPPFLPDWWQQVGGQNQGKNQGTYRLRLSDLPFQHAKMCAKGKTVDPFLTSNLILSISRTMFVPCICNLEYSYSDQVQCNSMHCTEKSDLCIPRNETARPRSQFLHSSVMYAERSWEYIQKDGGRGRNGKGDMRN